MRLLISKCGFALNTFSYLDRMGTDTRRRFDLDSAIEVDIDTATQLKTQDSLISNTVKRTSRPFILDSVSKTLPQLSRLLKTVLL